MGYFLRPLVSDLMCSLGLALFSVVISDLDNKHSHLLLRLVKLDSMAFTLFSVGVTILII